MTLRNFEFRIYPSQKQISKLNTQFYLAGKLYNLLLMVHKDTYRSNGKTLSSVDMNNAIKRIKSIDTNFKGLHSQVLQNVSDRLSKAFKSFFRRAKEKKAGKTVKVGYPRFKTRTKSITYPQSGFSFLSEKRLYISKIGNIPIVLHRLPKGKLKTMTVKRERSGKWFVVFSCDIVQSNSPHPHADRTVGIDVGLENFATLSDNTVIENPQFLRKSERRLKLLQRRLSRMQNGSKNRRKARIKVARAHEKIKNQRNDFLHKTSRFIADNYGVIGVESLNINGMLHNHSLAKHIADASWGTFLRMTCYKAESANGKFIAGHPFDPTTQRCSACGAYVPKSLADRIHHCPICTLKLPRDLNSAINIENNAIAVLSGHRAGHARINACGDSAATGRTERPASGVGETGTIRGS